MIQKYSGAIILGMHDALVSLTGMMWGLTIALADRRTIILTAIIASVSAGLSMAASNFLAEKARDNPYALRHGLATGVAYLATCALLVLPYIVLGNVYHAMIASALVTILVIFGCNWCVARKHARPWWRHAIEMLVICAGVSVASFAIGELAKYIWGIAV